MRFSPKVWALGLFVCTLFPVSSIADVIKSQSNDPTATFDEQLVEVLSAERAALNAVGGVRVERLMTPPPSGGLFSRPRAPSKSFYSREFLEELPVARGDRQWGCLAEALYFEARGETVRGMFAVAEVIVNRVASARYPDTICEVVNQGTGRKFACQFTYTCDGRKERITEPRAYERVGKIARLVIDGEAPMDLTKGATHYHTKAVRPRWSRVFPRTTTIGYHHFYRQGRRVAHR